MPAHPENSQQSCLCVTQPHTGPLRLAPSGEPGRDVCVHHPQGTWEQNSRWAVRQDREMKGTRLSQEEIKLSLFADDMTICIRKPQGIAKTAVTVHKINKQKLSLFPNTHDAH